MLALTLALGATACNQDQDVAGPDPEPSGPPPGLLESAIRLRVDLQEGRVEVVQPQANAERGDGPAPRYALLGRNEVGVEASNFSRTSAGLGKVRIRFDLKVVNKLAHSDLVTPTFPTPPSGVSGVLLFPFKTVALGSNGAPLPLGDVRATPSVDWNGTGGAGSGAPHNFFNSALCLPVVGDDCFRWEGFGTVAAGTTTAERTVGFDADLQVFGIDVYVVLAADVRENALTGAVGGTIISTMFGPLKDVLVTVTPGAQTGTSDAGGNYLISGLTPGSRTLNLSETPSSCFHPAPRTVSIVAGATADADFNLSCRPILYWQQVGFAFEIFSIRADGSGQTNLTNDGGSNTDPTWSPDASRIAYAAGGEIAVMNANGSGRDTLTNDGFPDSEPAWSPDGSRVAFVSFRSSQTDIWLINANGTGQTQLTTTAVSERDPTWSPDGSRIAFQQGGDIWVLDVASPGSPTKLTTNPHADGYPTWSPDGSKIAFVATDEPGDGQGGADHAYEIFTMNPDGSGLTRITFDDFFDLQPAWSPDGSTLVYVTFGFGTPDLFTVKVAGGTPVALTPLSQSSEGPTW